MLNKLGIFVVLLCIVSLVFYRRERAKADSRSEILPHKHVYYAILYSGKYETLRKIRDIVVVVYLLLRFRFMGVVYLVLYLLFFPDTFANKKRADYVSVSRKEFTIRRGKMESIYPMETYKGEMSSSDGGGPFIFRIHEGVSGKLYLDLDFLPYANRYCVGNDLRRIVKTGWLPGEDVLQPLDQLNAEKKRRMEKLLKTEAAGAELAGRKQNREQSEKQNAEQKLTQIMKAVALEAERERGRAKDSVGVSGAELAGREQNRKLSKKQNTEQKLTQISELAALEKEIAEARKKTAAAGAGSVFAEKKAVADTKDVVWTLRSGESEEKISDLRMLERSLERLSSEIAWGRLEEIVLTASRPVWDIAFVRICHIKDSIFLRVEAGCREELLQRGNIMSREALDICIAFYKGEDIKERMSHF